MVGISVGILIARLILGYSLMLHGSQKLFGWFGGGGVKGTGAFMESLGYRPGPLFALASGLGEVGGGLLTFLGLGGAIGPALIVLVMVVAILSVHIGKGFFTSGGGPELPFINIAAALAIAFAGNGLYSLDNVFQLNVVTDQQQVWIAIGAAVVVGVLNVVARRRPAAA